MKNKIIEELNRAKTVSIYIHINVDCDAMGSALAMKELLEQKGKIVDIYDHSNFPSNFEFYGDLSFVNKKTIEGKYDLSICLDVPNDSRLGKYKYYYKKNSNGNTICIDHHHLVNEHFCKLNYVENSSSTAEVIFNLLENTDFIFTERICKNLLSAILTDTGRFSHSTTENTFVVVSKLLKYGNFKIEDVIIPLFNSMRYDVFNMMRLAYNKMELYADKKFGLIMFSNNDFKENGVTLDDIDFFPDIPLNLKTVQFSILASEDDKGYFRVSFRSKGDISAKSVAENFGGGGHLNASGCKIFGSFDDVKQQLIDATMQTLGWKK